MLVSLQCTTGPEVKLNLNVFYIMFLLAGQIWE